MSSRFMAGQPHLLMGCKKMYAPSVARTRYLPIQHVVNDRIFSLQSYALPVELTQREIRAHSSGSDTSDACCR